MPTPEEFTALQQALAEALKKNESLSGELRVTRTERDLLKEQLSKFKRQLFAASSECWRRCRSEPLLGLVPTTP